MKVLGIAWWWWALGALAVFALARLTAAGVPAPGGVNLFGGGDKPAPLPNYGGAWGVDPLTGQLNVPHGTGGVIA